MSPSIPSAALQDTPTLAVLGGAIVVAGGKPMSGPAAHRHRVALLTLLAMGGLTSRDKLVGYLWPERDMAAARNLLKTAVHELRKVLGDDAIISVADQLELNPQRLRCDATEFETAVAAGDWARAHALYRGPFLDGFFLRDSSEFEDWASSRRLRLEAAFARVEAALALQSIVVDAPAPASTAAIAGPRVERGTMRPIKIIRPIKPIVATFLVAAAVVGVLATRALGVASGGHGEKPVELADDDPGHALQFNGIDANAATSRGTVVTSQTDDIAWDMLVRYDGPTGFAKPAVFYNGFGGTSGWGILLLGASDGQPDGTIGVLAGGIVITATPLVMKRGVWQQLVAERRNGSVTVWLDDSSFALGAFPVHPVGADHRSEERTVFGGDGLADGPTGDFHGAIDRVRVRDLASNFSIERFNFDEGRGSRTVGMLGAVIHTGHATWINGAPLSRRDVFWSRLQSLCGHAYSGRVANAGPSDSTLARGPLIMDVRSCTPTIIRGAFDAGDDRSRTWAITRTRGGLRLEEGRRRPDGSVEEMSRVGGETRDSGTVARQEFFAGGLPERTIEIEPKRALTYSVARGGGAPLQLIFDMTHVIASPPPFAMHSATQ